MGFILTSSSTVMGKKRPFRKKREAFLKVSKNKRRFIEVFYVIQKPLPNDKKCCIEANNVTYITL